MNERVRHLLSQMAALEDDLRLALHEQETSVLFRIEGKRVEFEQSIKDGARSTQASVRLLTVCFPLLVTPG